MTPEVALLISVWDKVRYHISAKERLPIAEELVYVFDENVDITDAEHELNELDSILKTAVITHYDLGLDHEDEY